MFFWFFTSSDSTFSLIDAFAKLLLVITGSALIILFCHKLTNYKKSGRHKLNTANALRSQDAETTAAVVSAAAAAAAAAHSTAYLSPSAGGAATTNAEQFTGRSAFPGYALSRGQTSAALQPHHLIASYDPYNSTLLHHQPHLISSAYLPDSAACGAHLATNLFFSNRSPETIEPSDDCSRIQVAEPTELHQQQQQQPELLSPVLPTYEEAMQSAPTTRHAQQQQALQDLSSSLDQPSEDNHVTASE